MQFSLNPPSSHTARPYHTMPAPPPSITERIASLTVNSKTGEYSKIHIFALALAALHVFALILWLVLTVRQRPVSVRDRVDPDKEK